MLERVDRTSSSVSWTSSAQSGRRPVFERVALAALRWTTAALAMAATVLVTTIASAADPRLYVIQNNTLFQVNPLVPNSPIQLTNAVWAGATSMTSDIRAGSTLYIIKDRKLWYVSTTGSITRAPGLAGMPQFEGATHMAFGHRLTVNPPADQLMVIASGSLYAVWISTGVVVDLTFSSGVDWTNTTAAASAYFPGAVDPDFFVIRDSELLDVPFGASAPSSFGGGWAGAPLMTSSSQTLYIIRQNTLHRLVPFGAFTRLTNAIWSGATSMTQVTNPTDQIYIIKDSKMWRVPGDGSTVTQLSDHIWPGPTLMTAQWVTTT